MFSILISFILILFAVLVIVLGIGNLLRLYSKIIKGEKLKGNQEFYLALLGSCGILSGVVLIQLNFPNLPF